MSDVLAEICQRKRSHIAACRQERPEERLRREMADMAPPRGFRAALVQARAAGAWGLVAEIKRASPAKGVIRSDFDPPALARAYAAGGASCLSVLTDQPYFGGDDAYIGQAKAASPLPVLRKDFTLEPYQVVEACWLGADAILVILAAVDDAQAGELIATARALGLDVVVEVHERAELDRARALDVDLIGINNRNLKTLDVDLETARELGRALPEPVHAIAESGLHSYADLADLARSGFSSFLVGEWLMRHDDVTAATAALLGDKAPTIRQAAAP